jgi:hypothetical protein
MNLYYKLIAWIVFIVFAIVAGIYFYTVMKQEERTYQADIYSFIPGDTKSILQINKFDRFSLLFDKNIAVDSTTGSMFDWINTLEHCISPLENEGNMFSRWGRGKLMISFHDEGEIYYTKLRSDEVAIWKDILENEVFPPFPPLIQKFEGMDILHYSLPDNRFFSCTFKGGVFIGSFNNKLIEKVVLCRKNGTSVRNDAKFIQISKTGGKKTVATLFHYLEEKDFIVRDTTGQIFPFTEGWTGSDITFMDNEIWFSGYYKPSSKSEWFEQVRTSKTTSLFKPELFPPETVFAKSADIDLNKIRAEMPEHERRIYSYYRKDSLSPDSLFLNFSGHEFHTIYVTDTLKQNVSKVYCLKINREDDFERNLKTFLLTVPKYYYGVKQYYTGEKRFSIIGLRNFNMLNDIFGDKLFPQSNQYYISFSNGYMIVADTEAELTGYLNRLTKNQSSNFSNLAKNLSDPCHVSILGNINMICQSQDYSPIRPAGFAEKYPDFFSKWKFGIHLTGEENLLFYHVVFGKK